MELGCGGTRQEVKASLTGEKWCGLGSERGGSRGQI